MTDNNAEEKGGVVLGFLVGVLFVGLLSEWLAITPDDVRREVHVEAVKHGAAYWHVEPDGSTVFRWRGEGVESDE